MKALLVIRRWMTRKLGLRRQLRMLVAKTEFEVTKDSGEECCDQGRGWAGVEVYFRFGSGS
jgi:hypothetical protein